MTDTITSPTTDQTLQNLMQMIWNWECFKDPALRTLFEQYLEADAHARQLRRASATDR
jgi:hypothetical protein